MRARLIDGRVQGDRAARRRVSRSRLALCVLALATFAGCATRPPPEPPVPESLLLTGYPVWFAADVDRNRDLLRSVFGELETDLEFIERTDRIVGGVRLGTGDPGSSADIAAVATGRYPPGATRFALGMDRTFARQIVRVDGRRRVYYQEREGTFQLAPAGRDLLYLSSGRIAEMLAQRPPAELELDADLYRMLRSVGRPGEPAALIVFEDPGRSVLRPLGLEAPALPLVRLALSLETEPTDRLSFGGTFYFRDERDAALFSRIGRLFMVVFVRSLGLEGAVAQQTRIGVDGTAVRFSGIPVEPRQLLGLVRRLAQEDG